MYRKEFYLTVLTALFTVTEVWAVMVVSTTVHVNGNGPALLAIPLTLIGSMCAVLIGLRWLVVSARHHTDRLPRS